MNVDFKANAASLSSATLINFETSDTIKNGPSVFYISDGTSWYGFSKICCDKAEKISSGVCPGFTTTTTTTTTTTAAPTTTDPPTMSFEYEVTGDGSGDYSIEYNGGTIIASNCGFGGCTTTLCIFGAGIISASIGSITQVIPATPCDPPINPP